MDGNELKTRRGELKLTQSELADEFGVDRNTINRWENGILKVIPKWVHLALLTLESQHKKDETKDDTNNDTSGEKAYYTKNALKKRGWTDAKIKDLLGEPDLHLPQQCGRMHPRYYYLDSRVEAIEKTNEFTDLKRNTKDYTKDNINDDTEGGKPILQLLDEAKEISPKNYLIMRLDFDPDVGRSKRRFFLESKGWLTNDELAELPQDEQVWNYEANKIVRLGDLQIYKSARRKAGLNGKKPR